MIFHFWINLAQIWHRDSNLDANSYFDSKRGFRDDSGQSDKKPIILSLFKTPLSITMATAKAPGDQMYFKLCVM